MAYTVYYSLEKTGDQAKSRYNGPENIPTSRFLKYKRAGKYLQVVFESEMCMVNKENKLFFVKCDSNDENSLFYLVENNNDKKQEYDTSQWYKFENVGTGKCMTSPFKSDIITMEPCDENRDDQRYQYTTNGVPGGAVIQTWHDKVINFRDTNLPEGSSFKTTKYKVNDKQINIQFEKSMDRTHRLIPYRRNTCLISNKENNALVEGACITGDFNMVFKIIKNDPPIPVNTDELVFINWSSDVSKCWANSNSPSSMIESRNCAKTNDYKFKIRKVDENSYVITGENEKLALEVASPINKENSIINIENYDIKKRSQKWNIVPVFNNPTQFNIQNVESKMCISFSGKDYWVQQPCNFLSSFNSYEIVPVDRTFRSLNYKLPNGSSSAPSAGFLASH